MGTSCDVKLTGGGKKIILCEEKKMVFFANGNECSNNNNCSSNNKHVSSSNNGNNNNDSNNKSFSPSFSPSFSSSSSSSSPYGHDEFNKCAASMHTVYENKNNNDSMDDSYTTHDTLLCSSTVSALNPSSSSKNKSHNYNSDNDNNNTNNSNNDSIRSFSVSFPVYYSHIRAQALRSKLTSLYGITGEKTVVVNKGAYGLIHLTRRTKDNKVVALKECITRGTYNEKTYYEENLNSVDVRTTRKYMLYAERKALSALQGHPRALHISGYVECDTSAVFILDYMKKGDLYALLHNNSTSNNSNSNSNNNSNNKPVHISPALLLKWIYEIIDFKCYTDEKLIFNTDDKTENILIDSNNNICMSDFGACEFPSDMNDEIYVSSPIGTGCYCCDEFMYTHILTRYTAVCACAVIMFEIVARVPPTGYMKELDKILNENESNYLNEEVEVEEEEKIREKEQETNNGGKDENERYFEQILRFLDNHPDTSCEGATDDMSTNERNNNNNNKYNNNNNMNNKENNRDNNNKDEIVYELKRLLQSAAVCEETKRNLLFLLRRRHHSDRMARGLLELCIQCVGRSAERPTFHQIRERLDALIKMDKEHKEEKEKEKEKKEKVNIDEEKKNNYYNTNENSSSSSSCTHVSFPYCLEERIRRENSNNNCSSNKSTSDTNNFSNTFFETEKKYTSSFRDSSPIADNCAITTTNVEEKEKENTEEKEKKEKKEKQRGEKQEMKEESNSKENSGGRSELLNLSVVTLNNRLVEEDVCNKHNNNSRNTVNSFNTNNCYNNNNSENKDANKHTLNLPPCDGCIICYSHSDGCQCQKCMNMMCRHNSNNYNKINVQNSNTNYEIPHCISSSSSSSLSVSCCSSSFSPPPPPFSSSGDFGCTAITGSVRTYADDFTGCYRNNSNNNNSSSNTCTCNNHSIYCKNDNSNSDRSNNICCSNNGSIYCNNNNNNTNNSNTNNYCAMSNISKEEQQKMNEGKNNSSKDCDSESEYYVQTDCVYTNITDSGRSDKYCYYGDNCNQCDGYYTNDDLTCRANVKRGGYHNNNNNNINNNNSSSTNGIDKGEECSGNVNINNNNIACTNSRNNHTYCKNHTYSCNNNNSNIIHCNNNDTIYSKNNNNGSSNSIYSNTNDSIYFNNNNNYDSSNSIYNNTNDSTYGKGWLSSPCSAAAAPPFLVEDEKKNKKTEENNNNICSSSSPISSFLSTTCPAHPPLPLPLHNSFSAKKNYLSSSSSSSFNSNILLLSSSPKHSSK